MARGKNKAIAERRREALEEIGSVERLQRRNLELEKENQTLKDQLNSAIDTHITQIASMQEQLDKNTSPKIKELEYSININTKRCLELEESHKEIKENWGDAYYGLIDYFMETDSTKYPEAAEKAYKIVRGRDIVLDDQSYALYLKRASKEMTDEELTKRVKTLQRIRKVR